MLRPLLTLLALLAGAGLAQDLNLLNVPMTLSANSTPRSNAAFAKYWKERTGQSLTIN